MILLGAVISTIGCALSLMVVWADMDSPISFFGFMTFIGLGNGLTLPNANAGMLSVRPHLAGTASGLGGSIMITGGAGLSALAGALLTPGTGSAPLIYLMGACSISAVISILLVMRRERNLQI